MGREPEGAAKCEASASGGVNLSLPLFDVDGQIQTLALAIQNATLLTLGF